MIEYRKGNIYQQTNNDEYKRPLNKKEDEDQVVTERILNPKTEKYEYKSKIRNYGVEWEEEIQKIKTLLQPEENTKGE